MLVHVDVQEQEAKKLLNTPGGDELLARVGGAKEGVPFFAFLSSDGQMVANTMEPPGTGRKGGNIGHPFEPHEVDWFMTMLSKAVPAMTPEDRAALEKPLRAQKK